MREAKTRKYHSPAFKAKVGLEAYQGEYVTMIASGRARETMKDGAHTPIPAVNGEIGLFLIMIMETRLGKAGIRRCPYLGMFNVKEPTAKASDDLTIKGHRVETSVNQVAAGMNPKRVSDLIQRGALR